MYLRLSRRGAHEYLTHEFAVPDSHPRAASLRLREKLVHAWKNGIVADAGLLAHGRGEAFDYIIGETTIPQAEKAIHAAASTLLASDFPVISVNGNSAALCSNELVQLSGAISAKLEVNLFYRSEERASKIAELLIRNGAREVLGLDPKTSALLPDLESERRHVDRRGILTADTVVVPLEDGDRTQVLRSMGKVVIAVDLNPLSRTAQTASITIVDNIVRAIPLLVSECKRLSKLPAVELRDLAKSFDNRQNLTEVIHFIGRRLGGLSAEGHQTEAN